MNTTLKILFAEDEAIHHMLAKQLLHNEGIKFEPLLVETKGDFLIGLHDFKPDIVITDFLMPSFTGLQALKTTLEYDPLIPVIILTGSINEEVAVDCMRFGATNYVIKENLIRLPFAVKEALEKKRALIEKKAAMIALQESESRLTSITNAAGDAIIMMDNNRLVSFWNPAAEKIFGFTDVEAIGKDLNALIDIENDQKDFLTKFLEFQLSGEGNTTGASLELQVIRKDGRFINVSITLSTVQIKEKWHTVGIVRDITDRKRAEEELIASKKKAEASDRLKSAFINNISHEVKTPLNGILGFSSLIAQHDLSKNEKEEFFSIIKTSSLRLLNTMTSFMDISLLVSGNMLAHYKSFDLHQILFELRAQFQPLCSVKNLQFKINIADGNEQLILFSDQEFIRKTLSYLLDNAVKFTHSGEVSFGYLKKNSSLEFFVKDTGIGIPKELQSVIFEHFMQEESSITRGYDGSGLGLSISNRLIKLLGGEFRVESEKGKGSIFLFTIPYKELESGMNNTVERNILVPFIDKPVILIVEDDEPGYHLMERMLRNTSASVISVRNAKDAVIRCREHPEISLVLMDLKIPNFNPIEATHEIKSFRQDLPVIAVADFVMSVDEKRVLEAGCDDCITKPVSPEVLLAKLKLYGVVINYQQEKC